MLHFIPNLHEKDRMLSKMGLSSIEELFSDIPMEVRTDGLKLPPGLSEMEIDQLMKVLGAKNIPFTELHSFLGAGFYHHFTPVVVDHLSSRSEFLTSYTPYQAEISQGMLQALFEYQSYISELTGLDISNSSLYDAATAIGEAALMCKRTNRKNNFIVASPITRKKYSVLENYTRYQGMNIMVLEPDRITGGVDIGKLKEMVDRDTCGIYVELPNFFGVLEEHVENIVEMLGTDRRRPLLVMGFNLLVSPLLKNPGELGADIAIGDVQTGNSISFGGPSAGYMCCRKDLIRKLPGRIIGYTHDANGEDAYVMTLQTREQHIRRGRATSNICSNQALCALRCAMTLACLGPGGMRRLSILNLQKAHLLKDALSDFEMLNINKFSSSFFNEFVVTLEGVGPDKKNLYDDLLARGIIFGYPLENDFEYLSDSYLLCATETTRDSSIEELVCALRELGVS